MKKILKIELSRAFKGINFFAVLAIAAVIVISHTIMNVVSITKYLNDYMTKTMIYPHSVFNKWIGGESYTLQSFLYFMLIPILAVIPFGDSFFTDRKSGFVKNIFVKTRKKYYFYAKYIAVFLTGGVAVVAPLLLNLAFTACVLPSLIPQASAGTFPIFSLSMWSELYYTHPYMYTFAYLVIIFVFSGFMATFALSVSLFTDSRFVVLLASFLVYLFLYFVCDFLGVQNLCPMKFLKPDQPAYGIHMTAILLEIACLAGFSMLTFFVKGIKDDTL